MSAVDELRRLSRSFAAIQVRESRLCPRDTIFEVGGAIIAPPLTVYRLEHNNRFPFECRYSAGERERRLQRRRARR